MYRQYDGVATFNYPHNWVKSKVLLLLLYRGKSTLAGIHNLCGGSYHSLASLLIRWVRWRYILSGVDRQSNVYVYSIAARGREFIDYRLPLHIRRQLEHALAKRIEELKAETEAFKANQEARWLEWDKILAENTNASINRKTRIITNV